MNGLFDRAVTAFETSEIRGDMEWLGEEVTDASSSSNDGLIFITKFIDTENGDDVLELFVTLEKLLDSTATS